MPRPKRSQNKITTEVKEQLKIATNKILLNIEEGFCKTTKV